MNANDSTRRLFLKQFGAAGAAAIAAAHADGLNCLQGRPRPPRLQKKSRRRRAPQRMQWWHEARFGMFIHWGLYSIIGQHEWAKESGGRSAGAVRVPCQKLSSQAECGARVGAAGQARRAKVHGDDHQASRGLLPLGFEVDRLQRDGAGPGRDLVREFVEAARAEGMRVGFYYSLMDWHHPDGAICKTD